MKSYDELKAQMEAIQQQMVEAQKNESANILKEIKRLCKEFGFTAGMLVESQLLMEDQYDLVRGAGS